MSHPSGSLRLMVAHITYQHRGYCTRRGYARLDATLRLLCSLGNAAIQERRDAWKMARETIDYNDQSGSLTLVRKDEPYGLGQLNVGIARGALKRVARAFAAFFRRCKAHENPGYPRFKSARRYRTIELHDVRPNHVQRVGNKLLIRINGLPTIRLRGDSSHDCRAKEHRKGEETRDGRRAALGRDHDTVSRLVQPVRVETSGSRRGRRGAAVGYPRTPRDRRLDGMERQRNEGGGQVPAKPATWTRVGGIGLTRRAEAPGMRTD